MTSPRTWLLLHGTPLSPAVWDATARHLDAPVHVPDLRRVPAGSVPQRRMAEAIAREVRGPVDIVGHSFGGQIALELALLMPDHAETLTIMCSRDTPFPAFAETAGAMSGGERPGVDASLQRWFTSAELSGGAPIVDVARRDLEDASLADWSRALTAIATYDSSARTPELRLPVSLLAAGLDGVSTPEAMVGLAARVPHATLTVRHEWAHMSPFVDPTELAAYLTAVRERSLPGRETE